MNAQPETLNAKAHAAISFHLTFFIPDAIDDRRLYHLPNR
jgi:hypothetical protein